MIKNIFKFLGLFFFIIISFFLSTSKANAAVTCTYGDIGDCWYTTCICATSTMERCCSAEVFCTDGTKEYQVGCYNSNSIPCSCCTQINCSCTPSCPAGASSTYSGPLCAAGNASCSQSNECSSCTNTGGACYYPETNTTFIQSNGSTSGPTSVSMVVDGKTYSLSTDPNNPTHIKLPALGSSNVQITTPIFIAPVTSRGANYYYQANNYGTNDEWKIWTTCSGIAGEDSCTIMPNANNTQSFVPTSKTVNQVLKQGALGEISAMYATTDKCDNTYKYSLPTKGYYIVDTLPVVSPITIPADTTLRGCTSSTYTGQEVNNPLPITARVTDIDGLDEIQSLTLWFSKDTNIPTVGTIAASYTGSITDDVGIMIKKNGSDWNNPNIYVTNSNFSWGQISLNSGIGYINVAGTNIIEIYEISVTQGTEVTFDYKIRFINTPSNLLGMYNVYGGALDTHMINGNLLDQSYFYKFFNWGIDLVNPTVEEITQQILDPINTNITWSNADTTSGIGKTIINGYRIGGLVVDQATLYDKNGTSKGAITLSSTIPSDSEIGLYNDSNAWQFINNAGETDRLNIQTNERGEIALYVTAYDVACNTNGDNANVDLDPWFATRGATVYSQGNISTSAKPVSGLSYLDGVFSPRTEMNSSLIDLGTELLSSRDTSISRLVRSGSGATFATEITDSNNTKGTWYNKLFKKFNQYKTELTRLNSVSEVCTTGKCYFYSTEDITIPQGYTCNKPIIFISEKDIHINPNVQSDNSILSGCIFLAKNNIYVDAGAYKSSSGTKVQYDYIEGYLIADNQIIFPIADETQTLRDAVEIFGGMVAFGTNPTSGESAISIKRNLRLYSQINPTVVLTYDNKYSSISTSFFGTEYSLYKQEVGFKTF